MKRSLLLFLLLLVAGCGKAIDGQYAAHLTLRQIDPRDGASEGGTVLVLRGTRFCSEMQVSVGGVPATQVQVFSPENATAVIPAHARGDATVEVACGGQSARGPEPFRYYAASVELAHEEDDAGWVGYADVDGDGILDAFKAVGVDDTGMPSASAAYEIHRGLQQGQSFDPTPLAVIHLPSYVAPDSAGWDGAQPQFKVADFTGDGTRDVMTFWRSALGIECRLFAAESGFEQVGQLTLSAAIPMFSIDLLRVVDLDGDGRQDLIVSDSGPFQRYDVSVLHGLGGISFEPRQLLVTMVSSDARVVEYFDQRWMNERNGGPLRTDFNGDQIDDLVLTAVPKFPSRTHEWVFVLGDRSRQYLPWWVYPPSASGSTFGLLLPDGGGPPDRYELVLAEPGWTSRRVRVWKGTGLGQFEAMPTEFSLPCRDGLCPELTEPNIEAFLLPRRFDLDLDGDGEYAMVSVKNVAGGNFPVWLGWIELGASAEASFVDSGDTSFPGTHGVHYGQFIDSLTPGPAGSLRLVTDARVRFIAPGGEPGAISVTALPPVTNHASSSYCMGDFDGDGLTDVLDLRDGKAWILTGRPDGTLAPAAGDPIPVRGFSCTPAHFTSPDRTDFYTLDAVYLNQGNGRFLEWLPAFPDITPSVVLLRGHPASSRSGVDDLVAFVQESGSAAEFRLLRASDDGLLRWVDQSRRLALAGEAPDSLADLNGDGFLDQMSCSEGGLNVQYGVPVSGELPTDQGIWHPDAPASCDWITQRVDQQGVFFLMSDGTVVRQSAALHSDPSAGAAQAPIETHDYAVTGHLVFPSFLTVTPTQIAVCNLRGRGRRDLVLVADGWFGVATQSEVNEDGFDPIIWWSLAPSALLGARLVGCGDVDGDGLDDLAVTDGSSHQLFLLRNGSH